MDGEAVSGSDSDSDSDSDASEMEAEYESAPVYGKEKDEDEDEEEEEEGVDAHEILEAPALPPAQRAALFEQAVATGMVKPPGPPPLPTSANASTTAHGWASPLPPSLSTSRLHMSCSQCPGAIVLVSQIFTSPFIPQA